MPCTQAGRYSQMSGKGTPPYQDLALVSRTAEFERWDKSAGSLALSSYANGQTAHRLIEIKRSCYALRSMKSGTNPLGH